MRQIVQSKWMRRLGSFVAGVLHIDSACLSFQLIYLAAFKHWAPKLHDLYVKNTTGLTQAYPDLKPPFSEAVFSAVAINFGPKTVCRQHRDQRNLSYGWCAVTSFGDYDWRKGGHLILWDLKVVIEMPPGCTVLLPSAIIKHSNTSLKGRHERRYSVAQFSAAGLFRWESEGRQPDYAYHKTLDEKGRAREARLDVERFVKGLEMIPSYKDICSRYSGPLSTTVAS
jgi:hypothetical protein